MEATGNRQSEPTIGTIVKNILIILFVILIILGLRSSIEDKAIREYRESIYEEVYEEGYAAGYDEGKNNGHQSAYEEGLDEGYDEGYEEGFHDGRKDFANEIDNAVNGPNLAEENLIIIQNYFYGNATRQEAIEAFSDLFDRYYELEYLIREILY